ncbi:MAG: endospore germination permease [Firmicutes bacterium]|nr:endospore germination permease [Bacillota bacterium]
MLEDGRITDRQFMLLIIVSRLILSLTYLPALNSPPENQDVWIAGLLSFPVHLLLAVPAYLLAQRFKDRSIIQSAELILGKTGKIIGALYVWFFLHMTALTLRQLSCYLTSVPYPETPAPVFIIVTALFAALAVGYGVETICRTGEIMTPVVMFSIFVVIILIAKDMDLKALAPMLEKGIAPVLHGALTIAARTVEILFVTMLLPYLNQPGTAKKAMAWGIFFFIFFFTIITVSIITTFDVEQAINRTFPFFSTVRLISIGEFLERIDAVHLGIWILGLFIKISIYYYLTALGAAQLFNLQDYRPIVLPLGTIIVSLSVLQAENMVELREFTSYKVWTWYALFFITFLPLILLVVAVLRRREVQAR